MCLKLLSCMFDFVAAISPVHCILGLRLSLFDCLMWLIEISGVHARQTLSMFIAQSSTAEDQSFNKIALVDLRRVDRKSRLA